MDSNFKFLVLGELIIILIIILARLIFYFIEKHQVNKIWGSLNKMVKNNEHNLDKNKFKQTIIHLDKINKKGSIKNGN